MTADRAALICAEDFEDVISGDKKLLYGAAFGEHEVQIEPLRRQLERMLKNPTAILELQNSHPATARRIVAEMEFMECETLYRWRPEKKQPGPGYAEQEGSGYALQEVYRAAGERKINMGLEERIIYSSDELIRNVEKALDRLKALRYDPKYRERLGDGFCDRFLAWEEDIRRRKDEPFTIAVVGDFKRGKSTLINALLGREVLTTDVIHGDCDAELPGYRQESTRRC